LQTSLFALSYDALYARIEQHVTEPQTFKHTNQNGRIANRKKTDIYTYITKFNIVITWRLYKLQICPLYTTSDNITFLNTYSQGRIFLRLSEYVKIKQVIIGYNNARNTSKSCYYLLSFACCTSCSHSVRLRPLLRPMVCPRPRSLSTFGSSATLRFAPRPLPRL